MRNASATTSSGLVNSDGTHSGSIDAETVNSDSANSETADTDLSRPKTSRWKTVLKFSVFLLFLAFVGHRGWVLWHSGTGEPVEIRWEWLAAAGLAYLVGFVPVGWYWQRLLIQCGQRMPLSAAIAGYGVSQIGKYAPGKGLVLVIRGFWTKQYGGSGRLGGLTAAYETLTFMAAGGILAVGLAPWMLTESLTESLFGQMGLGDFIRNIMWAFPVFAGVLALACLPVLPPIFNWLTRRIAGNRPDARPQQLNRRTIAVGLVASAFTWLFQALSLAAALIAVGTPMSRVSLLLCVGVTAFGTVGGFLAIVAPGGMGVREWLAGEVLRGQGVCTDHQIIAAVVLLRGTHFVVEVVVAMIGGLAWKSLGGMPISTDAAAKSADVPIK